MTQAEWGDVMSRIEAVSEHFDSAYRDLVLGAFRGPSQQLRFQPPVFSFDTPTIDIDIGAPMDVSPPPAFGDAEPIVPAAREKGKAKAVESPTKKERKESDKPWEIRIFDMKLHDELQPPVSGHLASRDFSTQSLSQCERCSIGNFVCYQPKPEFLPPPRKNSSEKTRCNRCRYQRQKCSLAEDFVASSRSRFLKVAKKSQGESSGSAKRQAGSKRKEPPVSPGSQAIERNVRTRSQGSASGSRPFVMVPSLPGLNLRVSESSLAPSSSSAIPSQISRTPSMPSVSTDPPVP